MPFAPIDLMQWTEDHYTIYGYFELALGNRRLLTETEVKEREAAERVDEIISSDDPDWLAKTMATLGLNSNQEEEEDLSNLFNNNGVSEEQAEEYFQI